MPARLRVGTRAHAHERAPQQSSYACNILEALGLPKIAHSAAEHCSSRGGRRDTPAANHNGQQGLLPPLSSGSASATKGSSGQQSSGVTARSLTPRLHTLAVSSLASFQQARQPARGSVSPAHRDAADIDEVMATASTPSTQAASAGDLPTVVGSTGGHMTRSRAQTARHTEGGAAQTPAFSAAQQLPAFMQNAPPRIAAAQARHQQVEDLASGFAPMDSESVGGSDVLGASMVRPRPFQRTSSEHGSAAHCGACRGHNVKRQRRTGLTPRDVNIMGQHSATGVCKQSACAETLGACQSG